MILIKLLDVLFSLILILALQSLNLSKIADVCCSCRVRRVNCACGTVVRFWRHPLD